MHIPLDNLGASTEGENPYGWSYAEHCEALWISLFYFIDVLPAVSLTEEGGFNNDEELRRTNSSQLIQEGEARNYITIVPNEQPVGLFSWMLDFRILKAEH